MFKHKCEDQCDIYTISTYLSFYFDTFRKRAYVRARDTTYRRHVILLQRECYYTKESAVTFAPCGHVSNVLDMFSY